MFSLGKFDAAEDLFLTLFVDANFCGDTDNTRSTSGAWLVLSGPNGTNVPLAHLVRRQTATSRSTTESEVVSLAHGLFSEAIPMLDLFSLLLERPVQLVIEEDNQATIKVVNNGYSSKL